MIIIVRDTVWSIVRIIARQGYSAGGDGVVIPTFLIFTTVQQQLCSLSYPRTILVIKKPKY